MAYCGRVERLWQAMRTTAGSMIQRRPCSRVAGVAPVALAARAAAEQAGLRLSKVPGYLGGLSDQVES